MMMKNRLTAVALLPTLMVLAGCATTTDTSIEGSIDRMLAGQSAMSGSELEREVAEAQAAPLGSKDNPVRVSMPEGQRAYLRSLRCENGRAPRFERDGSTGLSRYGNMMDLYTVTCPGSAPTSAKVYMDMYHSGRVETQPVPGFAIATR